MSHSGKKIGTNTQLGHAGYDPLSFHGFVNPPIVRASTVLFPDAETLASENQKYTYATHGTPTTDALCAALTELEGAAGTVLVPSESAGRVNGALGRLDWVPIRYVNRAIDQKVLAGLYRVARVGMVTPLRDGMNLVAKEFVAAQDPEDPGVLVLSRFAGAAQELDGAILVNPYDIEAVGNAVAKALSMPLEERRARFTPMMQQLSEHDISRWCSDFLDVLRG